MRVIMSYVLYTGQPPYEFKKLVVKIPFKFLRMRTWKLNHLVKSSFTTGDYAENTLWIPTNTQGKWKVNHLVKSSFSRGITYTENTLLIPTNTQGKWKVNHLVKSSNTRAFLFRGISSNTLGVSFWGYGQIPRAFSFTVEYPGHFIQCPGLLC